MKNFLIFGAAVAIIVLLYPKKRKHKTVLFLTISINNKKFKIYDMEFQVQEFVNTNLALVDHETQTPIGATFSNIVLTSSDPSVVTVDSDVNADGTLDIVGIASGEATINVKADATYTDSKTGNQVTVAKEANVTATITAPVSPEETDFVVTLSAPQPVPTAKG